MEIELKVCGACKLAKPLDDFYRDNASHSKHKRQGRCKDCSKAWVRQWEKDHPKDPEKERERLRRWAREHPEKRRAFELKRKARDPEMFLEQSRERSRKWRRGKPEAKIASEAARRERRGPLVPEDVDYIAILRRDCCCYCGGRAGVVDHIEPLHHGGHGGWENLTAACRRCNASKAAASLLTFLRRVA